jgi:predicted lipoprotein with Yx(FWY)xxD motif
MMPRIQFICRVLVFAMFMLAGQAHADISGGFLTGNDGLTYYIFDDDVAGSGKSHCNEYCSNRWHPVSPTDASGKDFSQIVREDGSLQLTYRGHPIYHYRYDHRPGDAYGDGKSGLWHAVRIPVSASAQSDHNTDAGYGY